MASTKRSSSGRKRKASHTALATTESNDSSAAVANSEQIEAPPKSASGIKRAKSEETPKKSTSMKRAQSAEGPKKTSSESKLVDETVSQDPSAEVPAETSPQPLSKKSKSSGTLPVPPTVPADFVPAAAVDHKVKADGTPLKIVCFNVNGLRAADKNGGLTTYLSKEQPDVVCLSEVKCQDHESPLKDLAGYNVFFNSGNDKGYAGTAVLSKLKPVSVKMGIGVPLADNEGRAITVEYDTFWLVNVYVPNSGEGLQFAENRAQWDTAFLAYLVGLNASKPVVLTGDLNVAHLQHDVYDGPVNKQRKKTAGFTDVERIAFGKLLLSGFSDAFRHLHPDPKTDAFTFWTYRGNGMKAKNNGWRLDYFVVSNCLLPLVKGVEIRKAESLSDHVPLVLTVTTP